MTPEDRELLQTLRREQAELQLTLSRIGHQLDALEAGAQNGHAPPVLPDLPDLPATAPMLQDLELPDQAVRAEIPPAPPHIPLPSLPTAEVPPVPRLPPVPRPSLEFQFARWLTRIGALFGVITVALILSYLPHGYLLAHLGRGGIISMCGAICVGVVILGMRLERKHLVFFGRSVLALGLAGLYVTLYAAHSFDPVRVIDNPLVAGMLLLLWSGYAFYLAVQRKSQSLALFSIALAYFSTTMNPIGNFTMAADLLLAGTAVVFLILNGWAALSYLSLLVTYFALLRRLVIDENGEFVLDTSRALPFAPYAVYLIGAWVIFTTAVMLSTRPSFRGGKRITFLSLNNGAFAGLMTLTTYVVGFGYRSMGWTLLWIGVLFIASALSAGGRRPDLGFGDVVGAYFAQGLGAFTLGLMGVCTGITRGVWLLLETFILGTNMVISRNPVVRIGTAITALLATIFLIWEISVNARHPWLLGVGGALVMLLNAWWSRTSSLRPPREFMPGSGYYCALGLGLLGTSLASELGDSSLAVALALVAMALTFFIYIAPLYELAPLAQTLLLVSQALVLFPRETGEEMPWSTTAIVALSTLVLLVWWSRQRLLRFAPWILFLNFVYSLALVGLADHAIRPHLDVQGWMMIASILSGAFLFFGAATRVAPLAAMGQLFLAAAVYHFFWPNGELTPFTWNGWAAAIPIAVVFTSGWGIRSWLDEYPDIPPSTRLPLRLFARSYELLALTMAARWIFGIIPETAHIGVFLGLGTFILAWAVARASAFGIRCSFAPTSIGIVLVALQFNEHPRELVTYFTGFALFLFLCQPTLLRHAPRRMVTKLESWLLILLSAGAGWLFVDAWVVSRPHPAYFTVSWALYAMFLFFFGLLLWERRQRWCGLVILLAAILRVFIVDIWGLSNGFKILTFLVLTLIALGLGFIYARFPNRLRTWL